MTSSIKKKEKVAGKIKSEKQINMSKIFGAPKHKKMTSKDNEGNGGAYGSKYFNDPKYEINHG